MLEGGELLAVAVEIGAEPGYFVLDGGLARGELLDLYQQLDAAFGVGAGSNELAGLAREVRADFTELFVLVLQLGLGGPYSGGGLVDFPTGLVGRAEITLQSRGTDCVHGSAPSAQTIPGGRRAILLQAFFSALLIGGEVRRNPVRRACRPAFADM